MWHNCVRLFVALLVSWLSSGSLSRVRNGFVRSARRFPIYIYIYRMKYFLLFFFLSSVERFTFCLAPGERKASRSGKSSGAWPFVGFHLSLPSDATHARLLSIPSVLPISFCVLWCAAAATGAAAACATAALCAAYASAAAACAGTAACSATAAYAASDSATVAAGLHHSCVVFRR